MYKYGKMKLQSFAIAILNATFIAGAICFLQVCAGGDILEKTYGQVLTHKNHKDVNHLDEDSENILKFLLEKSSRFKPQLFVAENGFKCKIYKLESIAFGPLLFTTDDKTPYLMEYFDSSIGPLLVGVIGYVQLTLRTAMGLVKHHYVISLHRNVPHKLHFFQHYYHWTDEQLHLYDNGQQDLMCSDSKRLESIDYHSNKTIHFSLLTFNLWNTNVFGNGDSFLEQTLHYQKRIRKFASIIRRTSADIVAIQEVRYEDGQQGDWGPNQIEHLARFLPEYQFAFQPAYLLDPSTSVRSEEGLAILSKFPILHMDYKLLSINRSDVSDIHDRILQHAEIFVPGFQKIQVFNTHLSLSHIARQRTVLEIWHQLRTQSEPTFLAGDFNAEAHNDEVRFLNGEVSMGNESTQSLVDVWLARHGTFNKGYTFNTLDKDLTKRIDLIFMKEHPKISLLDSQLVDPGWRMGEAASDHLAVQAFFSAYAVH